MIQLDFFLLYFIQLLILFHKNTIYKPHMWSCWNLRFSSWEYLRDESNKKSKFQESYIQDSYAALKWYKWYSCLEEFNQACAACCIWIETVFQLMLKSSSNDTLFFFSSVQYSFRHMTEWRETCNNYFCKLDVRISILSCTYSSAKYIILTVQFTAQKMCFPYFCWHFNVHY